MLDDACCERIREAAGSPPAGSTPLSGGCIADVLRVTLEDGTSVVVKRDGGPAPSLDIEGAMLRDLAETRTVRTPAVLLDDPDLLVLQVDQPYH